MALPTSWRFTLYLVTFAAQVASFELSRSTAIEFFVGIAALVGFMEAAIWLRSRRATTDEDDAGSPREPKWARILYACLIIASFDVPIGGWRGIHPVLAQLLFAAWVETHRLIVRHTNRHATTVGGLPR